MLTLAFLVVDEIIAEFDHWTLYLHLTAIISNQHECWLNNKYQYCFTMHIIITVVCQLYNHTEYSILMCQSHYTVYPYYPCMLVLYTIMHTLVQLSASGVTS